MVDLKTAATAVIVSMGSLQVGLIAIKRHFLVSTGKKTRNLPAGVSRGALLFFLISLPRKNQLLV
ncbi:hypothetical protein [Bordetella sp. 15P40C-2]|uniref:hypothetical protein n=1 Tax=Bordetella sp. 15P40C-2 TaxID=2572246 RepID=UPI00132C235F|nr:hypothetical protein [Bordetella sp. 15P40C-2]MVW70722.1 hypothetical protein [Bordetella sp. 15P40C-2]